jgi:hypothetical protein
MHAIGIPLQTRHIIVIGVNSVGEDHKPGLVFICVIDFPHVIVEHGTNAGAGSEKIFRHIHFPFHILLRYPLAILVGETEGKNLVDYRQPYIAETRYYLGEGYIKGNYQYQKKACIKDQFPTHIINGFSGNKGTFTRSAANEFIFITNLFATKLHAS